jgi:hypothetical protein
VGLPARPWREVLPTYHWLRSEVVEVVAASDAERFSLHEAMSSLIGEEHAATLMEHLPPAPWRELKRLGVPLDVLQRQSSSPLAVEGVAKGLVEPDPTVEGQAAAGAASRAAGGWSSGSLEASSDVTRPGYRRERRYGRDAALPLSDPMAHLSPTSWADLATKRDLDHLGSALRSELQVNVSELRVSIAEVRGELRQQTQTLFLGLVGLQLTGAGLAIALSRLL